MAVDEGGREEMSALWAEKRRWYFRRRMREGEVRRAGPLLIVMRWWGIASARSSAERSERGTSESSSASEAEGSSAGGWGIVEGSFVSLSSSSSEASELEKSSKSSSLSRVVVAA